MYWSINETCYIYILHSLYFFSEEIFSIPIPLVTLFCIQLSWEPWFITFTYMIYNPSKLVLKNSESHKVCLPVFSLYTNNSWTETISVVYYGFQRYIFADSAINDKTAVINLPNTSWYVFQTPWITDYQLLIKLKNLRCA